MSFLLLAAVSIPALSILHSHSRFRELFELEERVIAFDNSAISLGKAERDLFRLVQKSNRLARQMDAAHHVSHACAHVPLASAACRAADVAAERALAVLHSQTGLAARSAWRLAGVKLRASLAGKARVSRAWEPPIHPVRCDVCGLKVGWELSERPETHLSLLRTPRRFTALVQGTVSRLSEEAYQYRIREERDE